MSGKKKLDTDQLASEFSSESAFFQPTSPQVDKTASGEVANTTKTQVGKTTKPQTGKTTKPRVDKTTSRQVVNHTSTQVDKPTKPQVEKYTTHLRLSTIKAVKRYALDQDKKDYEIVQEALDLYFQDRGVS